MAALLHSTQPIALLRKSRKIINFWKIVQKLLNLFVIILTAGIYSFWASAVTMLQTHFTGPLPIEGQRPWTQCQKQTLFLLIASIFFTSLWWYPWKRIVSYFLFVFFFRGRSSATARSPRRFWTPLRFRSLTPTRRWRQRLLVSSRGRSIQALDPKKWQEFYWLTLASRQQSFQGFHSTWETWQTLKNDHTFEKSGKILEFCNFLLKILEQFSRPELLDLEIC